MLLARRNLNRFLRGLLVERTDHRELEQALGIGLLIAGLAEQLRQSGRNEGHRHALLRAAVQGGDQRAQFAFLHVLQLVDEHHQHGTGSLRSCRSGQHEVLEVVVEVAVVGQARLALDVEGDLDVLVGDLERTGKARQGPERAHSQVLGCRRPAEAQQRAAQLRGQHGGQGAVLGGFDAQRGGTGGLGIGADAIEQYRLAYAA